MRPRSFLLDIPRISMYIKHRDSRYFDYQTEELISIAAEYYSYTGGAHPNTAVLDVEAEDGRRIHVQASSLGGGRIMLDRIGGTEVHCTGERPTLLIRNQDSPGMAAEVTRILSEKKVNIATLQLYRDKRGGSAVMVIETDQAVWEETIERLKQVEGIEKVTYIPTGE